MSTPYFCKNPQRRRLVLDATTLNGIDYLEVSPDQQTLTVHLLRATGALTGENVRIEGGVRIRPVVILTATQAGNILTVTVKEPGDFSSYTLRLVQSVTSDAAPAGFDTPLSVVDFSFKVGCPSHFDCKTNTVCPPERGPEPLIDYLAKDYAGFRRLMLDRLAFTLPDWKERNPADLGVTLVELLAYTADHLSYYQDAVATEAYLGTARQRASVRRHARLLDYRMHDGCNARVWVSFEVSADLVLKRGTQLLTRLDGQAVLLTETQRDEAVRKGAQVFETLHEANLKAAHGRILFHTWGDEFCCLPKGSTRASLRNPDKKLKLQPGDVLIFEEVRGPGSGLSADADITRRHAVRLTQVRKTSDAVIQHHGTPLDVLEIAWADADALPFPFCLSSVIDGQAIADVSVACGNVVLADFGQTLPPVPLPPLPESGLYRPLLNAAPVTQAVPFDSNQALARSAADAMNFEPPDALPAIRLVGQDGELWLPQRDLLNSDRFAREFAVETEGDGSSRLRFGDGHAARLPEPGLQAISRVGNGRASNVGAEALAHVVSNDGRITGLRNPLPAQGGAEPEPMEQVRLYAPQAFRRQERAVTEADYAAVAQRHPEVQRAVATRRWTGSWHTMFITVDRRAGRPVDAEFEDKLRGFLEKFRLAGHDLEIDAPNFVALDLALKGCVLEGHRRSDVEAELLRVFSAHDLPDGRRGFFHPDNFTFGQSVFLSRIIATAMQVPGVHWVEAARFQRWGELPNSEIAAGQLTIDRLEIARLDNDPNAPENGQLELILEGGL